MVIVLIAARYKKILGWMKNSGLTFDIIKQDHAKIYLYVDSLLSSKEIIQIFHQTIYKECLGVYIYQLYGVYNEKIDFHDYLPDSSKDKMGYYHTTQKDITNKEIQDYKACHLT